MAEKTGSSQDRTNHDVLRFKSKLGSLAFGLPENDKKNKKFLVGIFTLLKL